MRLRDFLKAATLMSLSLITSMASSLPPALIGRTEFEDDLCKVREPVSEPPRSALPVPPELISKDEVLESVYYNTLSILSTSNRCSDFFGGPAASVEVFRLLMNQVRKDSLSSTVAMRMHGHTVVARNAQIPVRYRLFTKVSINLNGPFFRRKNFNSERTVFGVGSFAPNTREVRVLILLHELGHLIEGRDGNWLLQDDGGSEEISRNNSFKVEKLCGDQINSLREGEAERILAMRSQSREKLALEKNSPQSPIEPTGNH